MRIEFVQETVRELCERLPGLRDGLQAPASDEAIEVVEKAIGSELPSDLKALYRVFNGESFGLFFGMRVLSLDEMLREWRVWRAVEHDVEDALDPPIVSAVFGAIREVYASPHLLPIASDGGANYLGLDLAPGPAGRIGQLINFGRDEDERFVLAWSLEEWLTFLRESARSGRYRLTDAGDGPQFTIDPPENMQFLDTLDDLDLPVGAAPTAPERPEAFSAWFEELSDAWRVIVREAGVESQRDVERLRYLTLLRADISDLAPVSAFTDLRETILSRSSVSDLAPLASCRRLKKIYAVDTPVADVGPLANLQHLTELRIGRSKVVDAAPLADCEKLVSLHLEELEIANFLTLSRFAHLRCLGLRGCPIEDLGSLSGLTGLRELDISETKVADLQPLQSMPRLRELKIADVVATDLSPIAELPALKILEASIEQFLALRETLPSRVSVAIAGAMTPEQEDLWLAHGRVEAGEG